VVATGQRDLGAGDGAQAPGAGALGELHRPVQAVVVSEGESLISQLPRLEHQLLDVRGTVKEGEVGVGMEFSVGRHIHPVYRTSVLMATRSCRN
jgi:hypothetical protein